MPRPYTVTPTGLRRTRTIPRSIARPNSLEHFRLHPHRPALRSLPNDQFARDNKRLVSGIITISSGVGRASVSSVRGLVQRRA